MHGDGQTAGCGWVGVNLQGGGQTRVVAVHGAKTAQDFSLKGQPQPTPLQGNALKYKGISCFRHAPPCCREVWRQSGRVGVGAGGWGSIACMPVPPAADEGERQPNEQRRMTSAVPGARGYGGVGGVGGVGQLHGTGGKQRRQLFFM
jgi:hypothetical protein